jgi:competence ComEA-like helix-hairpin-helix protein
MGASDQDRLTSPSGVPRLIRVEAARVVALSLVPILLLGVSLSRALIKPDAPAPMPVCRDGAHRSRADGRIRCGPGEGDVLSATELLLVGTKLDLNTALERDLQLIPGVGPKLAQRIVDDRTAEGPFRTVEEVGRVRGIGPHLTASIARFARVVSAGGR